MSAVGTPDDDEYASVMFSPIKAGTPPPPSFMKESRKRLQLGSLFGSPAPLAKACITCGKTKCKCVHRSSLNGQGDMWRLEADTKQTNTSSPEHFTSREKADLRRWFEGLSGFGKGCIPSDELIVHLVTKNITVDERGVRDLLQAPADQEARNMTFFEFIRLAEKSEDFFYKRQLKVLVAVDRPTSKDSLDALPVVNQMTTKNVSEKANKNENSSFSITRQSKNIASRFKKFVSPVAVEQARQGIRPPPLHMASVPDSLSMHIDGDSEGSGSELHARGFPPSKLSPCKESLPSSPVGPSPWQTDNHVDPMAVTISRAAPSPLQKQKKSPSPAPPPHRMIQKQRSFDQLTLTKEKSFNELHVQRQDSFGPRKSFSIKSDEKKSFNEIHIQRQDSFGPRSSFSLQADEEGDGDIFDCLDRQIMEKTLRSGSMDTYEPAIKPSSFQSPIKVSKRHSTDFSSTRYGSTSAVTISPVMTDSKVPHLPDLSPAPRRRLGRSNSLRRSQSINYGSDSNGVSECKPFTPIEEHTKELTGHLKIEESYTTPDKKSKKKLQRQVTGTTHSFLSLSKDFSASKSEQEESPNDFGTLYDFVQNMDT